MKETTFYKLTLELNPKLNIEKVNLMERLQDVVEAKGCFNRESRGEKYLVVLNLTKQSLNVILRLDGPQRAKLVGLRTISRFVSVLNHGFGMQTPIEATLKQYFRLTQTMLLATDHCKAIVEALYSEENECINSEDMQKLFPALETENIEAGSCTTAETGNPDEKSADMAKDKSAEYLTASLQDALEKISALHGNSAFKSEIGKIMKFVEIRKCAVTDGAAASAFPFHYVFTGNAAMDHKMPAKLMAELFFHLGLVKKRKLALLNIPEDGNENNGINFECCIEVDEVGIVLVEGIFDGIAGNIDPQKVLKRLSEKMDEYKGRILFILSCPERDDRGVSQRVMMSIFHSRVNFRQIDFPVFNPVELEALIQSAGKGAGCTLTADAVSLVSQLVLRKTAASDPKKQEKIVDIGHKVHFLIEKAYSDKVFTWMENSDAAFSLSILEPEDFNFARKEDGTTVRDEAPSAELNAMIGLTEVKERLRQIDNVLSLRARRKELGMNSKPVCLHMQFTGNPGTGKTTVARIMGRILKNMGFLSSGHFVELTRNDLIGEYIGQTTPKVRKALNRCKGGIMFIDEAYSLFQGADNDYGYEAVSELVKGMEDNKDDMVIIFAGYPKEMEKMVGMNPGLRDRIAFTVEFPDYTPEELVQIFVKMCNENSYTLCDASLSLADALVRKLFSTKTDNFGNARVIRKLFERVEIIQSTRLCGLKLPESEEINKIELSDIRNLYEDSEISAMLKNSSRNIGFRQ